MSPKSFTFKLTVPRDPQVSAIVTAMADHAVTYAGLAAATGAEFVARVDAVAAKTLRSQGAAVQIVVTSDALGLSFAIDGEPVSASHSS
jgi:hypothetical protein